MGGEAWAGMKGEQPVPWDQLAQLDYKTGKYPSQLESKLKVKELRVAGYAIPVEVIDFENIREFILVPTQIGCCQGPPPEPNQIIQVTLAKGLSFEKLMGTVYLTGQLSVVSTRTGEYGYALKKANVFEPEWDI
jgi:hypothetical protein